MVTVVTVAWINVELAHATTSIVLIRALVSLISALSIHYTQEMVRGLLTEEAKYVEWEEGLIFSTCLFDQSLMGHHRPQCMDMWSSVRIKDGLSLFKTRPAISTQMGRQILAGFAEWSRSFARDNGSSTGQWTVQSRLSSTSATSTFVLVEVIIILSKETFKFSFVPYVLSCQSRFDTNPAGIDHSHGTWWSFFVSFNPHFCDFQTRLEFVINVYQWSLPKRATNESLSHR